MKKIILFIIISFIISIYCVHDELIKVFKEFCAENNISYSFSHFKYPNLVFQEISYKNYKIENINIKIPLIVKISDVSIGRISCDFSRESQVDAAQKNESFKKSSSLKIERSDLENYFQIYQQIRDEYLKFSQNKFVLFVAPKDVSIGEVFVSQDAICRQISLSRGRHSLGIGADFCAGESSARLALKFTLRDDFSKIHADYCVTIDAHDFVGRFLLDLDKNFINLSGYSEINYDSNINYSVNLDLLEKTFKILCSNDENKIASKFSFDKKFAGEIEWFSQNADVTKFFSLNKNAKETSENKNEIIKFSEKNNFHKPLKPKIILVIFSQSADFSFDDFLKNDINFNIKLPNSELSGKFNYAKFHFFLNSNEIFDVKNLNISLLKNKLDFSCAFLQNDFKILGEFNEKYTSFDIKKFRFNLAAENFLANNSQDLKDSSAKSDSSQADASDSEYVTAADLNRNFESERGTINFSPENGHVAVDFPKIISNLHDEFSINFAFSGNKISADLKVSELNFKKLKIKGQLKTELDDKSTMINSNFDASNGASLKISNFKDFINLDLRYQNHFASVKLKNGSIHDICDAIASRKMTLDMSVNLADFVDVIKSGVLEAHLDSAKASDIAGNIKVNNLHIKDYDHGVFLRDINIEIASNGKSQFKVKKGEIKDAYNKLGKLSGEIKFNNMLDFENNFQLEVSNFCLMKDSSLEILASGKLFLKGSSKNGEKISGTLKTDRAVFEVLDMTKNYDKIKFIHSNLDLMQIESLDKKSSKKSQSNSSGLMKIIFDIKLFVQELKILHENMNLILIGKLNLGGDISNLFLEGNLVTSKDSHIDIFRNRFLLSEGSVNFVKDYPFEPLFRIVAYKTISDIQVIITVQKKIDDFSFNLSSIPKLSDEKLLARILFNKDLEDLSPTDWLQIAYIMEAGKNKLLSSFENLRKFIGVDNIKFEKKSEKENGSLKIEKNLSNTTSLMLDLENNNQNVKIKREINKNFSGEISSNGEIGISYRYRY